MSHHLCSLLLFSPLSHIPGPSRIKNCDKSHIKIFFKSSGVTYIWIKTWLKTLKSCVAPTVFRAEHIQSTYLYKKSLLRSEWSSCILPHTHNHRMSLCPRMMSAARLNTDSCPLCTSSLSEWLQQKESYRAGVPVYALEGCCCCC